MFMVLSEGQFRVECSIYEGNLEIAILILERMDNSGDCLFPRRNFEDVFLAQVNRDYLENYLP